MSRPKGTGCIYQRAGTSVWWIKYSRNGQAFCESSHTTDKRKAGKILRTRLAEITTGTFLGPQVERVTVGELAQDFLSEYRANGRKSIGNAEARWLLHLKPFFAVYRAAQITTPLLNRYIEARQQHGAKNATCNREMAALKRMFNLGRQNQKVKHVPVFPRLQENNVRKGFLKDEEYDKLAAECAKQGLWLRAFLATALDSCWRKSELQNLRVGQVDLVDRMIRLNVGETKNGAGRVVAITDEVYPLISTCIRFSGKGPDDYVFTRKNGKRVRDFRKAWRNACCAAGLGFFTCEQCEKDFTKCGKVCPNCKGPVKYTGLIVHDLRRSGARNQRREGVAESVIMKGAGWKTAAMFRRYDIVDDADLKEAARRLNAKRERLKADTVAQNGYSIGYSDPKTVQVANTEQVN